ncbi:hypothetical protein FQA39_LY11436 [Lamprigera yunnana]|nr:hypothetical protein FQA39_LY11436 [Lamprigera yunnana]
MCINYNIPEPDGNDLEDLDIGIFEINLEANNNIPIQAANPDLADDSTKVNWKKSNQLPMDTRFQTKRECTKFTEGLSSAVNITTIHRTIGNWLMPDEKVRILTGLSWENLNNLCQKTSMRDSESRNVMQAPVAFKFKMRTGNSNVVISAVLGLRGPQYVSGYCNSVLNSLEKDELPTHIVFTVYTRDFLVQHHTAEIASRLHNLDETLAVICDGTYIYHEKSTNNFYERKSYSDQKKKPLCKSFTICTTDGFVIDLPGPYYSTQNDAEILRTVMSYPNGLTKLLQPGDVFILDRLNFLESLGYGALMPALKGNRNQLTAEESNDYRKLAKVRWPFEAVHGVIKKIFKLVYHQLDNKTLPNSVCTQKLLANYITNSDSILIAI